VRFPLVCATLVAGLFSTLALATQLAAQGVPPASGPVRTAPAAAAPSGTNVAVIDIAYIFKNHNRFNAAMGDIKRDIEQYDAYLRGKQKDFSEKKDQLQTFRTGTPEYRQKEEELARLQSGTQVEANLKRKEFMEQEARVYYRVYREIEQEVGVFAQRNRIGLVLRYAGDEMKEDDRTSVLQGVNRAVVYQQNLDITEFVLRQLNQGTTPPPTGPQGGAPAGPISTRPKAVVPGAGIPQQR
jgi:Skp family chaperone for outer membrane proteins